jgi:serine protease Do
MRRPAGFLLLAIVLSVVVAEAGATTGRWGWLGVRVRDLSEQEMAEISTRHGIREGFGAMIVEVLRETPAESSGLRSGDLLVAFRDLPVVDTRSLLRLIASAPVGETVSLTVLRLDEGRRRISVRLGAMPEPVAADRVAAEFGLFVREPEPQGEIGGARPSVAPAVSGVLPGSRAARAGVKVGDVLVEVNGRAVVTYEALRAALLSVPAEGPLPLVLRRDGERLSVTLEGGILNR